MLRIGIVEDDIDALINVIRNLLALDPSRYEFEIVPTLLSDPNIDTPQAIDARVKEQQRLEQQRQEDQLSRGLKQLTSRANVWPVIVQKGLLCPIDDAQRAEILNYLADQNVDAIICDSWLGKDSALESRFDEKALKLAGLMLLDDAEKVDRWAGKCWLMTMYQGDVFAQLQKLLEDEGWVPKRFNVLARFLKKDLINAAAPGSCYVRLQRVVDESLVRAQSGKSTVCLNSEDTGFGESVGRSPAMLNLYDAILNVAPSNVPVLIQGDSGVGKEIVAREIHKNSGRDGPYIGIDCGSLPEALIESELFGHVKGGFTGASTDKPGLFEAAKGGTILLDEIGNLPILMQQKLLRALQEGKTRRVGSNKFISLEARVLAATNAVLTEEVEAGRFRRDLFRRISIFPITVPPLRERKEDIALLCEHFISIHSKDTSSNVKHISADAVAVLEQYDWPTNVGELENVIQEGMIHARSDNAITVENVAIKRIAERNRETRREMDPKAANHPEAAEALSLSDIPRYEAMSEAEIWAAMKTRIAKLSVEKERLRQNGEDAEGFLKIALAKTKTLPQLAEEIGIPRTFRLIDLIVAEYGRYPDEVQTRLLFNSSYDACWKGWMHRNKRKRTPTQKAAGS